MNSTSTFPEKWHESRVISSPDQNLGHYAFYQALLAGDGQHAEGFVQQQLEGVQHLPCALPTDPDELGSWMDAHNAQVGVRYQHYLDDRHHGAAQLYFPTKAHALLFLQHIAPTKQVDGAWLHGMLQYSGDLRYHALIHTYLDEIGNGTAKQNHVAIFSKLLQDEGINPDTPLPDPYFQQGCIQLALGLATPSFLPEVIGFNLGYEMLPLHLLICTYELREWGIDPFYFSLHLTIDNAECGHARQALNTIKSLLPTDPALRALFYQRLKNGYRLNEVGISSDGIIRNIDLEAAVINILQHKAKYGQYMHSDYCRHGGKSVNAWLSAPAEIGKFLTVLTDKGWIKHDADPSASRFWHLIHGDNALMFGVFSAAEQQIVYDWLAGSWRAESATIHSKQPLFPAPLLAHAGLNASPLEENLLELPCRENRQLRAGIRQALNIPDRAKAMQLLIPYLAAPMHQTPLGLWACQTYRELLSGHL